MPNPYDDMNNLFQIIAFAALKEMDLSEMKGIELCCQISHRDFVAALRHPLRLRRDLRPAVAHPLSLPGGPLQDERHRTSFCFYIQKDRLRTSSHGPFVYKNRMSFDIRPFILR